MLNEGMTQSVDKCPQCITVKKEDRKVMGSIPYPLVEQVLDPEQMARYSRQLLRIESELVEQTLRDNDYKAADGVPLEYIKNCARCQYAAMIDRDAETFSCIECNKTSCPKCDAQPAHSDKTCE